MVSYHSRAAPGEDVASTHKIRAKEKIDKYFFFPITLPLTTRNVEKILLLGGISTNLPMFFSLQNL